MSDVESLKAKIALACRMLCQAQLVDYSGHISVRIPNSDRFLINPHPVSRAAVTAADVCTFDPDGRLLDGPWGLPSELPMHTRAYAARPDVHSVAHLHNRMVVVLSMANRLLYPASNTGALFGPGPLPLYRDPALIQTVAQGDAVARVLGSSNAAILRGHGSVVVGESIEWVFTACVDLEESATRYYYASLLGPVEHYTADELSRVGYGRRRMAVIQKVWDHCEAKARQAGLLANL